LEFDLDLDLNLVQIMIPRDQTIQMMMTKSHHLLTAKWKTLQMILTMKNLSLKLNLNLQFLNLELELQDVEPGEAEMRIFGVTTAKLTTIQLNLAPFVDPQLVHHYDL
jgi:DNA polymerase III sliding clamp (beta) subunit (PCNA family)